MIDARETAARDAWVASAESWIARLRQHERAENLLIEDAMNLDVGSGD